jgi:hypothetical protein
MSGEVRRKLLHRQAVNLSTSPTIVFGPMDCWNYDKLMVELYNPSGTETANGAVDISTTGSNFDTSEWAGLDAIGPGETRNEVFDKTLQPFIQVRFTATGSITNALVSVYAYGNSP